MTSRAATPVERFVVFADFLGTTKRYAQPQLVQRSRELLEQALVQCVVPLLNTEDMNLYVFSDTTIITCPRLSPLIKVVSKLFRHFIELVAEGEDDEKLTLWLRAGISSGQVLYVDHLSNGARIRTIPFLDTSFPKAYKLESIRKGSRLFLDPSISFEDLCEDSRWLIRWKQITGRGEYEENVGECLWPALAYESQNELAGMTRRLHLLWRKKLRSAPWEKNEYFDRMLHLDETVKLFVRSASLRCQVDVRSELLLSLLPKSRRYRGVALYEWGLWFQALRGLVEVPNMAVISEVRRSYSVIASILRKESLYQHFTKELDYPDYFDFRKGLQLLGLV